MTSRIPYEDINETLVGERLVAVSNTGERLSREQAILNDEFEADPPPISFIAWNPNDGAVVLGIGPAQRGLANPNKAIGRVEADGRRQTAINERPITGYEREIGIGSGGWIEVD